MAGKQDISIIIPVYNDPDGISETLRSLTGQTFPTDSYEIIVVDNDSTDSTPSIIRRYESTNENVHLEFERDRQSSYAARNKGIRCSNGTILSFVDSNMTVKRNWIEDVVSRFESIGCDYLACNVDTYIPDGESTIWAKYNKALGFPVKEYLKKHHYAPTCCLSVRAAVIDEVGLFDERLISGGDAEFGKRVAEADNSMYYAKDIIMMHPARTTFAEFSSKARRIGKGAVQRRYWYPDIFGSRLLRIRDFLPAHPFRYRYRFSETPTIRGYILFYLLDYIYRLLKIPGCISMLRHISIY